VSNFRLL